MSALFDAIMPTHAAIAKQLQDKKGESKKPAFYQLNKDVLQRVWMERMRQRELFSAGKLSFSCESPIVDNNRKARVITEVLGEICQEIEALEMLTRGRRESALQFQARRLKVQKRLQNELTQIVAVGFAWLESMEGKLP